MAIFERIITVYNDKGSKQAVKDLNKLEKNFSDASKKIAKAFAVATAAAGALAIKIGKDAVQAAMEDQKSQVLLANALRNTVGASDEAIAASESYITSLQNQLGIADDELRPALAVLATASGDLAQAQTLLGLSLDVAAGSGKSLSTITSALSKAQNGNFTALQRLFPALDRNAIASGDLVAITQQLAGLYGGAAQENANTFAGQMQILKLRFGEILETIGYRFLPILENLIQVINEQVVPAIEAWLEANGQKLANVFENAVGYIVAFSQSLFDAFNFVARNINVFKQLGAVIIATFAGAKVAAAVSAIIGAIKAIITVTKALRTATLGAAAAQSLLTGGISAAAGATAFAAALYGINKAMDKFGDSADKTSDKLDFNFKGLKLGANDYTKGLEKLTVSQVKNTAATKKAAAAAALELATKKGLAALAKLGVKPTAEKDPIQLEAARLNLLKQSNLEEAARVNALIANMEAQMKLNEAAQRYTDLLQVLSDAVISDEEVSVLAQKWNITKGEVLEYIARIYAANSTDLNDGPIVNLLMKWGLTKEEAEKYVDFTRALKDEKIDDSEIEKLMGKWGMTRAEVLAYGKTVQDGTALQAALSKGWSLPGDEAAQSWRNALAALNAYLAALGAPRVAGATGGAGGGGGGGGGGDSFVANPFNPASAAVSISKIEEQIDTLTSLRDATEKGTAISVLLKEHIDTLTDSISTSGLGALSDERARMQAMGVFDGPGISAGSTFDPGSFRMAENAGMTVNVTVEGNVQTEADLANAIRQRILLEQQSGNPILFVGGL
jgi:hypothetical protein